MVDAVYYDKDSIMYCDNGKNIIIIDDMFRR